MKLFKSKLDEMQEQKILNTESVGFYILYWGLMASIVIQGVIGIGFEYLLDGLILAFITSVYLAVRQYKIGVYDRFLKPNMLTTTVTSIIASVTVGFVNYGTASSFGAPREEAIRFGLTFGIVMLPIMFAVGTVSLLLYKKRRKKLDGE